MGPDGLSIDRECAGSVLGHEIKLIRAPRPVRWPRATLPSPIRRGDGGPPGIPFQGRLAKATVAHHWVRLHI
jgi:hypothetical protein